MIDLLFSGSLDTERGSSKALFFFFLFFSRAGAGKRPVFPVPQPATCPFLCRCAITTFPFSSHHSHPFLLPTACLPHTSSYMPSCRRKRVVLTEPSQALLQAVRSDPHKLVFYLDQTGEIFETYEYVPSYPSPNAFSSNRSSPTISSEPIPPECPSIA